MPQSAPRIEFSRRYAGFELNITPEIKAFGHVIDVFQDLRLCAVAFRPVPFLLEIGIERIGIFKAFDVTAAAGIAIPEPGTADAVTGFVGTNPQSQPAQPINRVQAGNSGADDDDVEIGAVALGAILSVVRRMHRGIQHGVLPNTIRSEIHVPANSAASQHVIGRR